MSPRCLGSQPEAPGDSLETFFDQGAHGMCPCPHAICRAELLSLSRRLNLAPAASSFCTSSSLPFLAACHSADLCQAIRPRQKSGYGL